MSDGNFCPKCGTKKEFEEQEKCSKCGYEYKKKDKGMGCIIALIVAFASIVPLAMVAALTVPTLVNRQSEVKAKTIIKKSIALYSNISAIYMIENDTDTPAGIMDANCSDAYKYFKIDTQDGCNFTTSDGAYWEYDPQTGYAAVTDSKDNPIFGVTLWTNNSTSTPSEYDLKYPTKTPKKGVFNAMTFLNQH